MQDKNRLDDPQPGYFKTRQYRGGPWVPAIIQEIVPLDPWDGSVLDRWHGYEAFINGRRVDPWDVWSYAAEIDRSEYKWLIALSAIRN